MISISTIDKPLLQLVRSLKKLNIDYVIVGGISVIIHGRIRTTMDIDVIVHHSQINRKQFVKILNDHGFDVSRNDLKNLDEQLHVSFFFKENMFRIDLKGVYQEKDLQSINEGIEVEYEGETMIIDNPKNLVLNKLIFGSQKDFEDAISVIENYPDLKKDHNLLVRAKKYGVEAKFKELLNVLSER